MIFSTMRLRTLLGVSVLLLVTLGFAPPTEQAPGAPAQGLYPAQQMYYLKKMKPDVKRIGVIWKDGAPKQDKKMNIMKRAVASIQGKLFVGFVEDKGDVGEKFRLLTRSHDIQALWIVENDGVVDASAPRRYLIKNAVKQGIPLLAPGEDWVQAGAPFAITKKNGDFHILLNEKAANATSLKVPDEYQSRTELVASAR